MLLTPDIRPSSLHLSMYLAFVILSLVVVPLYAFPSLTLSTASGCGDDPSPVTIKNANHIFNAIHSSMRQWGSSLNHNGMSFFLAEIPAGTELYHGRGDNVTVKGMEWLAFEPEHAMNFAMTFRPRDRKDEKSSAKIPRTSRKDSKSASRMHEVDRNDYTLRRDDLSQADHTELRHQQLLGTSGPLDGHGEKNKKPPRGRPHDGFKMVPGWLHTYKMKYDLRLVYIDGEAAAKSRKGTLDSQDYLLAPATDRDVPGTPGSGAGGDFGRAWQMCNMSIEEWGERIDGFIRMEHGFELILCDFGKSADMIRMVRVSNGEAVNAEDAGVSLLAFLKAIGARYQSIGGERVKINYDNFVTAFAADLGLFHGESDLPRLNNITEEQRISLLANLTDIVMNNEAVSRPINWQSIADMIIARYSDPLHSFAFDHFATKKDLDYGLTLLLRPFIDFDDRNTSIEVSNCAAHFLPIFPRSSIAGTAILAVSYRICSTLFSTLNSTASVSTLQSHIADLISWLRWTSWRECRPGCKYDEFCLTAIWPIGDVKSHERPYCVNATGSLESVGRPGGGNSYWDRIDGPHA